jgi:hypothetical protein
MQQKIMAVMAVRDDAKRLDGRIEMDDAHLGGARSGRRGRGAAGKTPFVAAVSTSDERRPRQMTLLPVKGFRETEIARLAAGHLAPASRVVTDGPRCRAALAAAGGPPPGRPSSGSTPASATARRPWSAPAAKSARSTPADTSPASPGASTAATSSTA